MSVVILIISMMIVGTMTARSMINKARLANARSLTQKSVVNDLTSDLVAWYETSLESSFESGITKIDGSFVSIWKDNNKDQTLKNDATMSTAANQPRFYNKAFYDSIPGVRFNGTDDFLSFNGTPLVKNSYTIFVVEQRRSNASQSYFIGGVNAASNSSMHLGYRNDTTITQAHYLNDMDIVTSGNLVINSYSIVIPRIHTFFYNNSIGKKYTLNGKFEYTNPVAQTSPLVAFGGAQIARYKTSLYYNGDIGEIIIFKRSLKTEEIEAIESYLGSKYGISVS